MLLNQSLWWIVPYALLMVFMLFAMMQFTVALLARKPGRRGHPVDSAELLRRLMALDAAGNPYRLVEGQDWDLELRWEPVNLAWSGRFSRVKLSSLYRARMLFDEVQHEVRWWEMLRTSSLFLGFDGWIPRFNWSWRVQTGYINTSWTGRAYGIQAGFPPRIAEVSGYELDTVKPKMEISKIITQSGWTFRPVLWWFETRRGGGRLLQVLIPPALKRLPARRFWGIIYPASFFLGIAYLAAVAGPLDISAWLWIVAVSAIWWGTWGFITWALTGFPAFWRRSSSSSE
jgi:hypothetical protein